MPGSRANFIYRLNYKLRSMAEEFRIDLLPLDTRAVKDGISKWHDVSLWYRSKQEILPSVAPLYGDLIGRLIAANQGRSFKCLVFDLDNTLWGGVVGDDGRRASFLVRVAREERPILRFKNMPSNCPIAA